MNFEIDHGVFRVEKPVSSATDADALLRDAAFFQDYDNTDLERFQQIIRLASPASVSQEHFRLSNQITALQVALNFCMQTLQVDVVEAWKERQNSQALALIDGEYNYELKFPSLRQYEYHPDFGDQFDAAVAVLKKSGIIRAAQGFGNIFTGIPTARLYGVAGECPPDILGETIPLIYTVKRLPRADDPVAEPER